MAGKEIARNPLELQLAAPRERGFSWTLLATRGPTWPHVAPHMPSWICGDRRVKRKLILYKKSSKYRPKLPIATRMGQLLISYIYIYIYICIYIYIHIYSSRITVHGPTWPLMAPLGPSRPPVAPRRPSWPLAGSRCSTGNQTKNHSQYFKNVYT